MLWIRDVARGIRNLVTALSSSYRFDCLVVYYSQVVKSRQFGRKINYGVVIWKRDKVQKAQEAQQSDLDGTDHHLFDG